jgi:hypothetical protein
LKEQAEVQYNDIKEEHLFPKAKKKLFTLGRYHHNNIGKLRSAHCTGCVCFQAHLTVRYYSAIIGLFEKISSDSSPSSPMASQLAVATTHTYWYM